MRNRRSSGLAVAGWDSRRRARSYAVAASAALFAAPLSGQVVPDAEPLILTVGETMRFGVQFGPVQLGRSHLTVAEREIVDGEEIYRLEVDFQAPIPFFRIHDRQSSWVARGPFRSLRFERFIHEGRKRASWRAHLDEPGQPLRVESLGEQSGDPISVGSDAPPRPVVLPQAPLDDLAILYEMRHRIASGETSFVIDGYYLAEDAPAVFELERRERTRVPAGRFDVFVMKSVVPGMLMFKPEANARIHVGVDPPHPLVMITTETRHGRLTLYLREFHPGSAQP